MACFGWGAIVMLIAPEQNGATILALRFFMGAFEAVLVPRRDTSHSNVVHQGRAASAGGSDVLRTVFGTLQGPSATRPNSWADRF